MTTSTITLQAEDGHSLSAFLAEPLGVPAAGIVVIQEIFGVNSHIQHDATRFADAGYLTIAPHMFDRVKTGVDLGYTAETIAEGRDYAMALTPAGIMADVKAAAAELRRRGVTKIGIVGYCFGGTVSATAACNLADEFAAAVAYYGGGVGDLVKAGMTPKIPLILHFGERDVWIPSEVVDSVEANWPGPVYRYDANHGFHCDHRSDFDQTASDLAQGRTLAWFAEHLG
jgi:carboxymethylenebutenolidase